MLKSHYIYIYIYMCVCVCVCKFKILCKMSNSCVASIPDQIKRAVTMTQDDEILFRNLKLNERRYSLFVLQAIWETICHPVSSATISYSESLLVLNNRFFVYTKCRSSLCTTCQDWTYALSDSHMAAGVLACKGGGVGGGQEDWTLYKTTTPELMERHYLYGPKVICLAEKCVVTT